MGRDIHMAMFLCHYLPLPKAINLDATNRNYIKKMSSGGYYMLILHTMENYTIMKEDEILPFEI